MMIGNNNNNKDIHLHLYLGIFCFVLYIFVLLSIFRFFSLSFPVSYAALAVVRAVCGIGKHLA